MSRWRSADHADASAATPIIAAPKNDALAKTGITPRGNPPATNAAAAHACSASANARASLWSWRQPIQ